MRRALVILCMDIGLAVLLMPLAVPHRVQIVYNPSNSVPRGWYRIAPADALQVGGIVLAPLPAPAAALAAQRDYLPAGVPLLKRVGAMAPQQVCVDGESVRIDDVVVATVMHADGHGRPLSAWSQCRSLERGELFLLSSTNPASFDIPEHGEDLDRHGRTRRHPAGYAQSFEGAAAGVGAGN